MWKAFLYTIPNTAVVINNTHNAVEVPLKLNQIINYDQRGRCVEYANYKRIFSCGLGAGVMSSTSIFFKYIPEIPTIEPTDLHVIRKPQQKTTAIYISDITNIDIFNFNMKAIIDGHNGNHNNNNGSNTRISKPVCSLNADDSNNDSYVTKF